MREILKQKGYKITPARLAILDIFSRATTPLTAESVYRELRKTKHPDMNEATVYRTLSLLGEANILRRVDLRKESVYFELAREHHHHITCMKCETVEDFESLGVEKALRSVIKSSKRFINIKDHSLELFGVCKECS